jgi:hypothetical protein
VSTKIRFTSFPQTEPPPSFIEQVTGAFKKSEERICTETLSKGLTSDQVLGVLAKDLAGLGFQVETGKSVAKKIDRPVFFGENGVPTRRYQIDGFHATWRCGLEIEAGRAWMGNAIYRDLIQACVMVDVDHLCLAVPLQLPVSEWRKARLERGLQQHHHGRIRPLRPQSVQAALRTDRHRILTYTQRSSVHY